MDERKTEFKRLLSSMIKEGLPFVILRSYDFLEEEQLPAPIELDVLVEAGAYSATKRFFFQQGYFSKRYLSGWLFRKFAPSQITFHVQFGAVEALKISYLSYAQALNSSQRIGGYPVLAGAGLIAHLSVESLIAKGRFTPRHRLRIEKQLQTPQTLKVTSEFLLEFFPKKLSGLLISYLSTGEFDRLENRRTFFIINFLLKKPQRLSGIIKYAVLRLQQHSILPRRGRVVAFIGVDGVGKTTLAEGLLDILRSFNYRARYVYMGRQREHILPMDKIAKKAGLNQRKIRRPGKLFCLIRDCLYAGDMFLRYFFCILPYKLFNHVIVCDRYAYDLFLDKHQTPLSRWLLRRLYPRPDILFLLVLDEPEIVQRKDEYDAAQRRFFTERWQEVAKDFRAETLISDDLQRNCFLVHEQIAQIF
ncbi:hypothetical protein ACFL1I_03870 [Candidatus Omnitrophota bacterium]